MKISAIKTLLLISVLSLGNAWSQTPGDLIHRSTFELRPVPTSANEAAAFLARSTYGPTASDISQLRSMGYLSWIESQMALPPSLHRPLMESLDVDPGQGERLRTWWELSLSAPDQLRQRVAFALSEILVISDSNDALAGQAPAVAEYYDILVRNAFGNYRDLLEEVTLTPTMGFYLSMFRSTRYLNAGIEPDENFAREVMQLFSIGLELLNLDGSVQTDAMGQPIPTYGQTEIIGLAEAFSGWNFNGASNQDGNPDDCEWWEWQWADANWLLPMEPCEVTNPDLDEQPENYHVASAKMIVGGVMLPANQTAEQDLGQALDTLFNHANVGPFIGTRLIQRLVTSNPSPAYVARVATVFNDNGSGIRGDLGAVVRAILMDWDAMDSYLKGDPSFGKLREPLLMVTHLYRAFDAVIDPAFVANPEWVELINNARRRFAQSPLGSPSVFNFFKPGFAQPGAINNSGLLSPEFQIVNESQVVNVANFFFDTVVRNPPPSPSNWITPYQIQIDALLTLSDDPAAILDRLNTALMSGQMSPAMHQIITDRINLIPSDEPTERVTEAIYYVITSPEYLVQR